MPKTLCRRLHRALAYFRYPRPQSPREQYFRTVSNRRIAAISLSFTFILLVLQTV